MLKFRDGSANFNEVMAAIPDYFERIDAHAQARWLETQEIEQAIKDAQAAKGEERLTREEGMAAAWAAGERISRRKGAKT